MFHFETERLVIKPHTAASVDTFYRWENDLDLVYVNDDDSDAFRPVSLEAVRRYVGQMSHPRLQDDFLHFAIHTRPDDRLIGDATVGYIDRHHRRCKVGITIGEKSEWGKGYAREALEPVIAFCFIKLGLNRIGAEIYCFNERSRRLFESMGFQREGLIRQSVWKGGQPINDCLYGLLREDWEKTHPDQPSPASALQ
jgi:RimJ/RimL family protein N-acetyltransferase